MKYLTLTVNCETIRVSIPSGTLSLSSNPSGADIYLIIGGISTYTGLQTPNTIDLYPGLYSYTLKLSGYDDYNGIAIINTNEITNITIDLVAKSMLLPVLTVGSLSVMSLGLILASTAERAIPITTGLLGGKKVDLKL